MLAVTYVLPHRYMASVKESPCKAPVNNWIMLNPMGCTCRWTVVALRLHRDIKHSGLEMGESSGVKQA